jgi:hypothetical protein
MKVTLDIDCTPEEARRFFGLPDVQPLQAAMMQEIEGRMRQALSGTDAETLMKTWLPLGIQGGMQGLDQMQKMFWAQMTPGTQSGAQSGAKSGTKSGTKKGE